jgi:hypothetical protein
LLLSILHGVLWAGLALMLTLITGLALVALVPATAPAALQMLGSSYLAEDFYIWSGLAFVFVVFAAWLRLGWTLRLRSWWWVGGGWMAVAPVLAYLAVDDPVVRRPIELEDVAPSFPGAEVSYKRLALYTKGRPASEAFQDPGGDLAWPARAATDADYAAFLQGNRARIEAGWAQLAPIRAWYDELNTFERIGDTGTTGFGTVETLLFRVHRSFARLGRAQSGLLTLAENRDAAVATVLPILEVGRKIQTHARNQARAMIGLFIRREALRAIAFALDRGSVSPAMQARLAAALAADGGGETGIRRIIAIDYAATTVLMPKLEWGGFFEQGDFFDSSTGWRKLLNPLAHFFYNRNRTLNLMGEVSAEVQELAVRRRPEQADEYVAAYFRGPGRPGFKNLIGESFAVDAFDIKVTKLVANYWEIEDLHAALRQRVAGL